jgi:hypothetical protein
LGSIKIRGVAQSRRPVVVGGPRGRRCLARGTHPTLFYAPHAWKRNGGGFSIHMTSIPTSGWKYRAILLPVGEPPPPVPRDNTGPQQPQPGENAADEE